jgi:hypothetical protein
MTTPRPSQLPADPGDPHRYGVYLRPDPATCWAVTQVTAAVRAQYGLVSAGAFPPHATLVGSQHVPGRVEDLVAALDAALRDRPAFPVTNAGPTPMGNGAVYDVDHHADGTRNSAFQQLAAAVDRAVAPLTGASTSPEPNPYDPDTWAAHLSLASHDLLTRPDLVEEVREFIAGLPISYPTGFLGDTVALYRTTSADWTGRWWQTLTWQHLRTWRLRPTEDGVV